MSINANNATLNEILETINELPSSKEEQDKTIYITENGETVVTPDDENTTLSKVTVNVDVPIKEEQSKTIDITKNGTTEVTPDEGLTLSKVTVNVDVPTGGGNIVSAVEEKDITFIDYDGTLVASYTIEEAHALTALPQPPNHDGLTFQSWNWTLDEVKQWNEIAYIGAHYATTDGKTRIYFTLDDPEYLSPALNFQQSDAYGVVIDWGDGSPTETSEKSGIGDGFTIKLQHTYATTGDYVITIECVKGSYAFHGNENISGGYLYDILTLAEKSYNGNKVYLNTITKLEIGDSCIELVCRSTKLTTCNVPECVTKLWYLNCISVIVPKLCNYFTTRLDYNVTNMCLPYTTLFNSLNLVECLKLKRVSIHNGINTFSCSKALIERIHIPDSITTLSSKCFENCFSLKKVTGCKNISSVSTNAFAYNYSLQEISLPEGITALPNNCFAYSNLQDFVIPNSVTNIGQGCFNEVALKNIIIPKNVRTVGASVFYNCRQMTKVIVQSENISFGNKSLAFYTPNYYIKRYYDFTKATVNDGILSYTFGTDVFQNIREGSVIMFATKEIADVAKTTTNLTAYADYIHYLGEEEATE